MSAPSTIIPLSIQNGDIIVLTRTGAGVLFELYRDKSPVPISKEPRQVGYTLPRETDLGKAISQVTYQGADNFNIIQVIPGRDHRWKVTTKA